MELIPEGIEDVKETAMWIKDNLDIKSIQCSDVRRTIQTTEIVSDYLDLSFVVNFNLREQNKGDLNGVLRTELSDGD